MNHKSTSGNRIYFREDIPLVIREKMEKLQIISENEQWIAFYDRKTFLRRKFRGFFLTNLRFIDVGENKIRKYVFLSDIRASHIRSSIGRHALNCQLIDGSVRSFPFLDRQEARLFRKIFLSIKKLDIDQFLLLTRSSRSILRAYIEKLISFNTDMERLKIRIFEKMFQCRAEKAETIDELMLRLVHQRSGVSPKSVWDKRIDVEQTIVKFKKLARRKGLHTPSS